MKLLAINGSYRGDKGHTGYLLDLLFQGARETGAECKSILLARHKINHCLACDKCHQNDHFLQCAYRDRDGVAAIFEEMAQADLIIYAAPVYLLGLSGLLKIFIDRMYSTSDVNELQITKSGLLFHHVDRSICSKPFVSLICCDNLENEMPENAISYFRTFSRFMDAPHVGELVRSGGKLVQYGHDLERPQRFPRLEQIYNAYIQAGRELALRGRIEPMTQRQASQEIISVPFFKILKNLPAFKPVMLERAKEMLR
ncbi:MAG TPA: flavodoxin family protein [Anaerolineales bacterium]|nr:flavodoxin family protein [Anaerolineales bacterium]